MPFWIIFWHRFWSRFCIIFAKKKYTFADYDFIFLNLGGYTITKIWDPKFKSSPEVYDEEIYKAGILPDKLSDEQKKSIVVSSDDNDEDWDLRMRKPTLPDPMAKNAGFYELRDQRPLAAMFKKPEK